VLVKPLLIAITKRDWTGMERIPKSGGVIIAVNHMSEFDPLVVAHFVYDSGRWPQFLAKDSLFKLPVLGPLVAAVKQIPVARGTADASKALDAAVRAIGAGQAVIIYPEGTTPKKGELWPQRGKTGIARLWLETDVPIVPVATWGAQQVFDPRVRKLHLRLNTPVTVRAGAPIDLSRFKGLPPTSANLNAITDEIMSVLRTMVGEIRGETPPEVLARRANDRTSNGVPLSDLSDLAGEAAPEPGATS
jgi:1-acyl-sn-glycerol-3-phosphate acyltransferase